MKITNAKNPRWANAKKSAIDLIAELDGEELPFTATADDVEQHGRDLFERAERGDFGPIAAYVAPPAPVPQVVSRFQARAALHLAGLLGTVQTMMENPATDPLARLAWQDAQEFRRNSPTVLAMGAALGLTDSQLDALFVQAATIQA